MFQKMLRMVSAIAIIALLVTPLAVFAHGGITAGDYEIEYGWVNEPVYAGETNAIEFNVTAGEHHDDEEDEDHTAEATIAIIAPADGDTIQGDSADITVAADGLDEHAAEEMHYHLYVDERVVTMAPVSQTTLKLIGLSNGSHTLKVSLAGADHAETGEPTSIVITVEGSSATGDVSVAEVEPIAGDHSSEALDVDVSGIKVELVYAGQTTELALEPAEGGEPGQFVAPFTPERAGQYMLRITGTLNGSLGSAEVNAEVEPEEVAPNPSASSESTATTESGGLNSTAIAVIAGVGVLLVVAIVGAVVVSRRK
jgi:hypothetical protein